MIILFGIGITSTGEIVRTEISELLPKIDEFFELFLERITLLNDKTNIEIKNFNLLKKYLKLFSHFKSKPVISSELFSDSDLVKTKELFEQSTSNISKVNELEEKINRNYQNTIFDIDHEKLSEELNGNYSNFFRYLKPSYYRFAKNISSYLKDDSLKILIFLRSIKIFLKF